MFGPKILLLYNEPYLPEDHPEAESEHSVLEVADYLVEILEWAGYRVSTLGIGMHPEPLWRALQERQPDVVFNLYEGCMQEYESESYVAGLLQWSGTAYTGSPMRTLSLCRAKHLTKGLLHGAGLPTAPYLLIDRLPVPQCQLNWPVIIKPAQHDASIGLDQNSVVMCQADLERRAEYLAKHYGLPLLAEEFIAGREINVCVTEVPDLRTLPASEVLFKYDAPGYWPILTYESKWIPGTVDHDQTPPVYPADITPELAERLSNLAMRAHRLLGCQDYCRVDFRVRADGEPFILEVNPNPEVHPEACFGKCLEVAGLDYRRFILKVVETALTRQRLASKPQILSLVKATPKAADVVESSSAAPGGVTSTAVSSAGSPATVETPGTTPTSTDETAETRHDLVAGASAG